MASSERIQKGYEMDPEGLVPRTETELQQPLELDIAIVLGEGPVKPVLIPSELDDEKIKQWSEFKKDPLHTKEPDFFVIEGRAYLEKLEVIDHNNGLSEAEKSMAKAKLRDEWQHLGRFALKRMGRQNALAAGVALLRGATKEVILSGGHSIPQWKREEFKQQLLQEHPDYASTSDGEIQKRVDEYINYSIRWPSEAELMKDIIVRQFDADYKKKHNGRSISEVIRIEDKAANTLENIVLSINADRDLLSPEKRIGILSANHHIERGETIAERYGIHIVEALSAQRILAERAQAHHREEYAEMEDYMQNVPDNPWLQDLVKGEIRFMEGLTKEQFLTYWLGYTFKLEDPHDIQHVLGPLEEDPQEAVALKKAFAEVGISLDKFKELNLEELAQTNPKAYNTLRIMLTRLTQPGLRAMPPEVTTLPPELLVK